MDVSVDTVDCVYLNVHMCGEINATTTREIIKVTAEEHRNKKNVKTELDSIQEWKANLLTRTGSILSRPD